MAALEQLATPWVNGVGGDREHHKRASGYKRGSRTFDRQRNARWDSKFPGQRNDIGDWQFRHGEVSSPWCFETEQHARDSSCGDVTPFGSRCAKPRLSRCGWELRVGAALDPCGCIEGAPSWASTRWLAFL